MLFPAVINLSTLDGSNGFQISGEGLYNWSGFSVASAGDVNGDGFADLIIGAPPMSGARDASYSYGSYSYGTNSGASYVVFGKDTGFAAILDLSTLDGSNGFQINGEGADDWSGHSVASAGDVNGDGFDDLIIGADGADPNGASYVVFGKDTATVGNFDANFDLSSLDGSNGFQINGSGFSVASAGDVNGDGVADLIVGTPGADPNGGASGVSYVVFGQASGFSANLDLSTLDGSNGFQISGEAANDFSGWSVASAGDVNGDGFADLIIGAAYADPNGTDSGASYVVFGKDTATAGNFDANLDLSSLDGSNGFQISGEAAGDRSGRSVASAGDVNGDGFDDLIIGAVGADPNGASYVVFGQAAGFAANLNLSSLNGSNGFQISGELAGDQSGFSVASAGDVNGDGIDDLIIGANSADPNGDRSGASYVVFGKDTATAGNFDANLDLSALDGSNGFQISGEAPGNISGSSVASAGDVNRDGFADLIIGAPGADASYVVFGGPHTFANQPPAANAVSASGTENAASIAIMLSGSDADAGDAVDSFKLWGLPANGTLYLDAALTQLAAVATAYAASANQLTLYFVPDANWNGQTNFQYTANDGELDSVAATAAIDVTAVNDAPTADTVSASGAEDAPLIAIILAGTDPDAGDAVDSFKLSGLPAHGTFYLDAALTQLAAVATAYAASANQLTLYFVPDANWNGQTDFQYTANDGELDSVAATAAIDVTAVNDAPTLASAIADQTATRDQAFSFTLPAGTFADVDAGDMLSLSTSALPSWLTFNAATGTFSGTPGSGNVGVTNVIVTATDLAGAAVSDTFSLTVSSAGNDSITGTAGDDVINAQGGNDTVNSGDGNDTVLAGSGNDVVNAGNGNDTIVATIGDGDDAYTGGAGMDTLDMSAMTAPVTINLRNGYASSSQTGVDRLNSIENATGGSGNDQITGNDAANVLDGGAGNDKINAGWGNDIVIGGTGDDLLTGGAGNDTFVFADSFGNDLVQGFDANPAYGQDSLDISAFGIAADDFAERVTIFDDGDDTLVMVDDGGTIRLVGIGNATTVTMDDFTGLV